MNPITYFLFGFFVAFTGSITPSMLNMTVLKISRQKNRRASINYSLGVSIVVVLQAYIAVYLYHKSLEYLNPAILESIERLGIGIFIILSFLQLFLGSIIRQVYLWMPQSMRHQKLLPIICSIKMMLNLLEIQKLKLKITQLIGVMLNL